MNAELVFSLSSVLYKSYWRSSANRKPSRTRSSLSNPLTMLAIDAVLFVIPCALAAWVVFYLLPSEYLDAVKTLSQQTLAGMPILIASAVIIAGVMFELGQGGGFSSSEAINWLPLSPSEYVAASSMSIGTFYSPFLALSAGVSLPLALKFGILGVWGASVFLSIMGLGLGAFLVEVLRAVTTRVSSAVYKKSGRFGIITRLVLIILVFVIMQMAFNPNVLYIALGAIVNGVSLIWFVPMVWSSVAVLEMLKPDMMLAIVFTALSVGFVAAVMEAAVLLRGKYWSPVPVSISVSSSTLYSPKPLSSSIFGFSPIELALAMKDFRALTRRKDMARYIALPVMLIVSFLLPFLFGSGVGGRGELFLLAFEPVIVASMFSSISLGQEGSQVMNLYMLPISQKELLKGKLLPAYIFSMIGSLGGFLLLQLLSPTGVYDFLAMIGISAVVVLCVCLIGLGLGSRRPDFASGPNPRYVTQTGLLLSMGASGAAAAVIYAPLVIYSISSSLFMLPMAFLMSVAIGLVLSFFSYKYCLSGIKMFLAQPRL